MDSFDFSSVLQKMASGHSQQSVGSPAAAVSYGAASACTFTIACAYNAAQSISHHCSNVLSARAGDRRSAVVTWRFGDS